MDYTQILHTLQNAIPTGIWYLIPLFILAAVIKSPWFKGKAGEAVTNLYAKLFLDRVMVISGVWRQVERVAYPVG